MCVEEQAAVCVQSVNTNNAQNNRKNIPNNLSNTVCRTRNIQCIDCVRWNSHTPTCVDIMNFFLPINKSRQRCQDKIFYEMKGFLINLSRRLDLEFSFLFFFCVRKWFLLDKHAHILSHIAVVRMH